MDSDVPERAWSTHMSAFEDLYRAMDFARNLTVPIDFGPDTIGGFSFVNKKRSFTERDRLQANLLQPHLEQAYKNACLFTQTMTSSAEVRSRPVFDFTVMESRVAFWLAAGKTNWEIGVILGCAPRTAEKHVERILQKLHVENRTAAAALIVGNGPADASNNAFLPVGSHASEDSDASIAQRP